MRKPAAPRQSGGLLLTVLLLLAVMAALAFGLNRGAGMNVHAVQSDYERRSVAYLAQAGVAASRWTNQVAKCSASTISSLQLGGATINATATKGGGKLTVNSTAAFDPSPTLPNGLSDTATSTEQFYDLSPAPSAFENKNLAGGTDSTLTLGTRTAQNTGTSLSLDPGASTSVALLYWSMSDVLKNTKIVSATLTLTPVLASLPGARTVNVQRVTTMWDQSATWTQATAARTWSGGDTATAPAASAGMSAIAPVAIDVTGLADSWYSGTAYNDGLLLSLAPTGLLNLPTPPVSFYSFEYATASMRPTLNVSFAKSC